MRTLTTFSWLLELLPELLADHRVQVVFTTDDEHCSAYQDGAVDALQELGGRVVPWAQAVATPFSLAIAASPNGRLERLQAPLLILPHGPGYSKHGSLPGDGVPPLPTVQTRTGWRTLLVLSHAEQQRQWREDSMLGVHTAIVGDPVFDRLRASLPERERYRHALGVDADRKLVVTSSTWGPGASLAVAPELPARLLAELPADRYAVAAILHPNIWIGHGPWQVRLWLRRALEAGLLLMPVEAGWQAALVAADQLIGDHGSVALYGAALGLPLSLSAFETSEIVDDTPLRDLADRAQRLDHHAPLRAQVEQTGFERDAGRYAEIVRRVFAEPGRALEHLRVLVYDALELEPPPGLPRSLPVDPPALDLPIVTAHAVRGTARIEGEEQPRVTLERSPAVLRPYEPEPYDFHLAVDVEERDRGLREAAAVIYARRAPTGPLDGGPEPADTWLATTLDAHPGARATACALDQARCAVRLRGGLALEAMLDGGPPDPAVVGSAVYLGWLAGLTIEGAVTHLQVATGTRVLSLQLTPLSGVTREAARDVV